MSEALQLFLNTLASVGGLVAAVALGIMLLTAFFYAIAWFSGSDTAEQLDPYDIPAALAGDTTATVHMLGGRTFENVRVVGLDSPYNAGLHGLSGMVVLEDADGQRFFVCERHIRLIVVPPTTDAESA